MIVDYYIPNNWCKNSLSFVPDSAHSTDRIDMKLNPDKISQYKLDVMKTEHDIRAEKYSKLSPCYSFFKNFYNFQIATF